MTSDPSNVSWRKLSRRVVALAFAWSVIGGGLTIATLKWVGFFQVGDNQPTGWKGIISGIRDGSFSESVGMAVLAAVLAFVLFRLIGYRDYSARELAVTSQVTGGLSCCCCAGLLCLPTIILASWALAQIIRNRDFADVKDAIGGLLMGLLPIGLLYLVYSRLPHPIPYFRD